MGQHYLAGNDTASAFPIHCLHSSGFYLLHSQTLCISYFCTLITVHFILRQTSQRSLSKLLNPRSLSYSAFGVSSGPQWDRIKRDQKTQNLQKPLKILAQKVKDKLHQQNPKYKLNQGKKTMIFLYIKHGILRNFSLSTQKESLSCLIQLG